MNLLKNFQKYIQNVGGIKDAFHDSYVHATIYDEKARNSEALLMVVVYADKPRFGKQVASMSAFGANARLPARF